MLYFVIVLHTLVQGLIQKNERRGGQSGHTKGSSQNFWLTNYSLGCVICFVSIHVLLQLSVFYHHHEENEANYAVWLFCSKYVHYSLFTN